MITGNEPAMPQIKTDLKTYGLATYPWSDIKAEGGLTIRQQFAMAAMQGIMANETHNHLMPGSIAREAVCVADYLIAELNKPIEP